LENVIKLFVKSQRIRSVKRFAKRCKQAVTTSILVNKIADVDKDYYAARV